MSAARELNAHRFERHPDDWYVEPPWCNQALFRMVRFEGTITDPCCGEARILDAAAAAGYQTFGCDIADRGAGLKHTFMVQDFFAAGAAVTYRNIVCNPPYKYDLEFVLEAVRRAEQKCYVLLFSGWANGEKTSAALSRLPLAEVLQLTPRPSMPTGDFAHAAARGEIDPHTGKPCKVEGGRKDFAWYGFVKGYEGPVRYDWCRRRPVASIALPKPKVPVLL